MLRTGINAAVQAAGLTLPVWTDPSPAGVTVKAAHIIEMRRALAAALTAFGQTATFQNSIGAGLTRRAVDFQELRDALEKHRITVPGRAGARRRARSRR